MKRREFLVHTGLVIAGGIVGGVAGAVATGAVEEWTKDRHMVGIDFFIIDGTAGLNRIPITLGSTGHIVTFTNKGDFTEYDILLDIDIHPASRGSDLKIFESFTLSSSEFVTDSITVVKRSNTERFADMVFSCPQLNPGEWIEEEFDINQVCNFYITARSREIFLRKDFVL